MTNKETESNTTRGQGLSGVNATATKTLVKANASTPTAVKAGISGGLGTTPPATAANFDRTVVTSLAK